MKKNYDDFMKNFDSDTVDYNNPNCINCNDCCGCFSLITEEEYRDLKRYFTKNKLGKEIYKMAVKRVLDGMREHDSLYLKCPLSSGVMKCSIYSRRPKICRDFHCKPELNLVGEEDKRRKEYGGSTIFMLFKDDLLKDKEFEYRFMQLATQVIKDKGGL